MQRGTLTRRVFERSKDESAWDPGLEGKSLSLGCGTPLAGFACGDSTKERTSRSRRGDPYFLVGNLLDGRHTFQRRVVHVVRACKAVDRVRVQVKDWTAACSSASCTKTVPALPTHRYHARRLEHAPERDSRRPRSRTRRLRTRGTAAALPESPCTWHTEASKPGRTRRCVRSTRSSWPPPEHPN